MSAMDNVYHVRIDQSSAFAGRSHRPVRQQNPHHHEDVEEQTLLTALLPRMMQRVLHVLIRQPLRLRHLYLRRTVGLCQRLKRRLHQRHSGLRLHRAYLFLD